MKTYKELQEEANKKAREELKVGLSMLTEGHRRFFKKMYSHEDLDADINNIVDSLPNDRIGWAMQQVKNSLIKMGLIK